MKRIVIADDSGTARMFVRRCLEIAGCQDATFVEVENGKEALAALKESPTDFVVADLNMPVMDGEALLKWIKASPRLNSIPVVIVTSAANPAKEKELADMGALVILAKPVSPANLSSALGPLLEVKEEDVPATDDIDKLREIIVTAVMETLENMAFMEVIQTDQSEPESPDLLKASILVHDPFPGELRLVMPRELAATIAEALYSPTDESEIDKLLLDVLAELLNTIAGRVMAEVVSHEDTFRLGLPETGVGPFAETDLPLVQCAFEVEGDCFFLAACGDALPGIMSEGI